VIMASFAYPISMAQDCRIVGICPGQRVRFLWLIPVTPAEVNLQADSMVSKHWRQKLEQAKR